MSTLKTYDQIFINLFNSDQSGLKDLTYQGIPQWDSVGHMALVGELEDAFGIMLDTEDIIDLSSYEKGKEILKKYDVTIA